MDHQTAVSNEDYYQKLREAQLKNTQTRLAVFETLRSAQEKHLTAEGIYKLFLDKKAAAEEPSVVIGLTTIYRVLADFESAGIVKKVHFDNSPSTYELASAHHDHIVCSECQRITEFHDPTINHALAQFVKQQYQAEITGRSVLLYTSCTGACKDHQHS